MTSPWLSMLATVVQLSRDGVFLDDVELDHINYMIQSSTS